MARSKRNNGLRPKIVHLHDDVINALTVKGTKKKPRITAKEYIQELAIKEANK